MEIGVFILEMFRSSGVKKQISTDLVGILWGGCLGYSEVTGSEGCDCKSRSAFMNEVMWKRGYRGHLEGN